MYFPERFFKKKPGCFFLKKLYIFIPENHPFFVILFFQILQNFLEIYGNM